uniref:Uncharacterized protein n=1 Tax=Romanomermis culicivorax TaxID=13658 RepID=A0A915HRS2_ROMCU
MITIQCATYMHTRRNSKILLEFRGGKKAGVTEELCEGGGGVKEFCLVLKRFFGTTCRNASAAVNGCVNVCRIASSSLKLWCILISCVPPLPMSLLLPLLLIAKRNSGCRLEICINFRFTSSSTNFSSTDSLALPPGWAAPAAAELDDFWRRVITPDFLSE